MTAWRESRSGDSPSTPLAQGWTRPSVVGRTTTGPASSKAENTMAEGRGWIVGVFLATLAVYALAAPQVLAYLEPPMGDQPHYLMTVISLVEDHDLDLRNNYTTAASDDEFDPPPMLPGYRGIAADYPLEPGSHAGPTRN